MCTCSLSDYHLDLQLSYVLSVLGYHDFCIPNLRLTNSNYLGSGPQPAQHSRRSQLIAAKLAVVAGPVGWIPIGIPRKWLILGLGILRASSRNSNPKTTNGPRPKPTMKIIRWNHLSLKEKHVTALLHPGRLTWNLKMMVWKMIFLFNWVIFRFHVNLPGCRFRFKVSKKPTHTPKVCQDER